MRILLTNEWLVTTGGTGTFTYSLAGGLRKRGHEVYLFTNEWGQLADRICNDFGVIPFKKQKYDLILANHTTTIKRVYKYGLVIQTCHGIFPELEQPSPLADGHISISLEVQKHLIVKGYPSLIINNPIDCTRFSPQKALRKNNLRLLSLCHSEEAHLLIQEAANELKYSFKYLDKRNNWKWNVEDAINEADIVFGIGRSAYEALACGRPVIIFDNRHYFGNAGDGYFLNSFEKSLENNCSGRAINLRFTKQQLIQEIQKYNPSHGPIAREIALKYFNLETAIDQYLEYKSILEEKKNYSRISNKIKRNIIINLTKKAKFLPKPIRSIGKMILSHIVHEESKTF